MLAPAHCAPTSQGEKRERALIFGRLPATVASRISLDWGNLLRCKPSQPEVKTKVATLAINRKPPRQFSYL